jgi:hypothetical protein
MEIVAPHMVDDAWPRLAHGFDEACKHCDDWTAGTLWQCCRSGNAYLILTRADDDAIVAAGIWQFEDTTFRCLAFYGHGLRYWAQPVKEWISELARQNGAAKLAARGRRGWLRMFDAVQNGKDYEVAL